MSATTVVLLLGSKLPWLNIVLYCHSDGNSQNITGWFVKVSQHVHNNGDQGTHAKQQTKALMFLCSLGIAQADLWSVHPHNIL